MNKIDVYYRAFKSYRKETKERKDCLTDLSLIKEAQAKNDILEATKYLCIVDEEWVQRIEVGLTFVEKALAEERQFIRSDGEIVPIEKVKKISRSSVEHLARHSNMITHVPEEGNDLVPDKIYMVEKLSDYAVYENRFLYMLLSYLHEFIMYRLEKIEKISATYDSILELDKDVTFNNQKIKYEVKITDHRENNPYSIKDEKSALIIQRIRDCDQIINAMLNTDLMVQVSKSPMIKPPITKTNVLKMNNNFKNALALYDYIASYSGLGFETEEVKRVFHPFNDFNASEIAEALNLTSFISYKIGNEIEDVLNTAYEEEEERRRQQEAQKMVDRINRIKKKARENGQTLEEYMLLLEDRNKMLEKDSQELILARNKVFELNKIIDDLNQEKIELNHQIADLNLEIAEKVKEIDRLNQKYIDDMKAIKLQHEEDIKNLNKEHADKIAEIHNSYIERIDEINENHQIEIDELNYKHQEEVDALNDSHYRELNDMREEYENERSQLITNYSSRIDQLNDDLQKNIQEHNEMKTSLENKIDDLNSALKDTIDERKAIVKEYEQKLVDFENSSNEIIEGERRRNRILQREKEMMRGEMNAMRLQNGKIEVGSEFATRERFMELEEEFVAFNAFFKEQWKYTKKEIRKMILWERKEKKKKINSPIEEIIPSTPNGTEENNSESNSVN